MKRLSNRFRVMVAPFGKFTLKSIESFSWKGQIIHCAEYASIKLFYLNTVQALKASLMTFSTFSPHCSLHSSHTDLSPVAWTLETSEAIIKTPVSLSEMIILLFCSACLLSSPIRPSDLTVSALDHKVLPGRPQTHAKRPVFMNSHPYSSASSIHDTKAPNKWARLQNRVHETKQTLEEQPGRPGPPSDWLWSF